MSPEARRRIAYSVAAIAVIVAWRPLRNAIESDGLFFFAALAAMLIAATVANRLSR